MDELIHWLNEGENQRLADLYASHLTSGFCHELNNIFTAMFGNISMAHLYMDKDPNKAQIKISEAEKALNRARTLVNRVHQTSTKKPIIPCKLNVLPIIKSEISQFNDPRIVLSISPTDWQPTLMVAEDLFRTALHNALTNALETQGPMGDTIPVTLQEITIAEANYCEIAISNYLCDGLADPTDYYFIHYRTEKTGHSGLGLGLIRSIMMQHHGQVEFSTNNHLATLKLRFPLN